ncbi:MAG: helix-turn-helix transcriptional regulator [Pirellulales bacterium]|nr:helix-turn-helix transcriptional regulator [Planctomycetales bacterium]
MLQSTMDVDTAKNSPRTIDLIIEERRISLEELSASSRLDERRVLAIVSGRWTPSPLERQRLAEALGVAVADVSWGHTVNPRNIRYFQHGLEEGF